MLNSLLDGLLRLGQLTWEEITNYIPQLYDSPLKIFLISIVGLIGFLLIRNIDRTAEKEHYEKLEEFR